MQSSSSPSDSPTNSCFPVAFNIVHGDNPSSIYWDISQAESAKGPNDYNEIIVTSYDLNDLSQVQSHDLCLYEGIYIFTISGFYASPPSYYSLTYDGKEIFNGQRYDDTNENDDDYYYDTNMFGMISFSIPSTQMPTKRPTTNVPTTSYLMTPFPDITFTCVNVDINVLNNDSQGEISWTLEQIVNPDAPPPPNGIFVTKEMTVYRANDSKRHNICLFEGDYKLTIESQTGLTEFTLVSVVNGAKQLLVKGGDFNGSATQEFSIPGVDAVDSTSNVPTFGPTSLPTPFTVSARPPL